MDAPNSDSLLRGAAGRIDAKLRVQRLHQGSLETAASTIWRIRVEFRLPGTREDGPRIAEGYQPTEAEALAFVHLLALEQDPCVAWIDVDELHRHCLAPGPTAAAGC